MGGMPDWFAKTKEMIASDLYFSLADAKSAAELKHRYHTALARLDRQPSDYAQSSEALEHVWKSPRRIASSLDGHFVGDWIHFNYYANPAQYGHLGGSFWPAIPSQRVVDLVREGTKLAIHKALGDDELQKMPGMSAAYRKLIWEPEVTNGVDVNGVRPLATSWNCVAPAGDTYFEVAALRGPSVVEFAIATPKPYEHSPMMHIIEKVLHGQFAPSAASAKPAATKRRATPAKKSPSRKRTTR